VTASRPVHANIFQSFDIWIRPAAILKEVRFIKSPHIFYLQSLVSQITADPLQCSNRCLRHYSLAQDQAIGKLFTDHGETVPWGDFIYPLWNELFSFFVEDRLVWLAGNTGIQWTSTMCCFFFHLWARWSVLPLNIFSMCRLLPQHSSSTLRRSWFCLPPPYHIPACLSHVLTAGCSSDRALY